MGAAATGHQTLYERPTLTEMQRRGHLESLPAGGFSHPAEHQELIDDIVTIGLPVDNYSSLTKRPNTHDTEGVLGSWGTGSQNYGDFSIYPLLDYYRPEKRWEVLTHEGSHASSPLDPHNNERFGGREGRHEAAVFALRAAEQSLMTGKYVDGYQRYLAEQLVTGEINMATFVEESWAIMSEKAMTNRKHLEQVQDAQQAVFLRQRALGVISPDISFTQLVSRPEMGQAGGIDKYLVRLYDGVSNLQDLTAHAAKLKEQFRSVPNEEWVMPRGRHEPVIIIMAWLEDAVRPEKPYFPGLIAVASIVEVPYR